MRSFKKHIEEGRVTPGDLKAQAEGKKAARKGQKYDENPYEKGSSRHLQWSKGHNAARAGMKEEVELEEAKRFNKGDSVKIKNVRKYDALAKDDEGTVIGMMGSKVMVKVGSGQMNVDPKDLVAEAFTIPKGKAAKDYMDKKVQRRNDMNKKNDPGAAKKHLALSVLDKDKARAKAKKKGVKPSEFEYAVGHKPNKMTLMQKGLDPKKARSGKKLPEQYELELSESEINDITAQYINENNISLEELENMSQEQLDEIIGKAIGGAFKLGAKAAVGTARLAGKAAKRAVMTKQGSIRGTKAAKQDREGDKAEKEAKRAEKERAQRDRIKAARDKVSKARSDLNKAQAKPQAS